MKILFHILIITLLTAGCHKRRPALFNTGLSSSLQDQIRELDTYSDSINKLLPRSELQQSLIFSRDNYSFFVSRYVLDSEVNLYVETGIRNNNDFIEKRYYLNNGNVILFVQNYNDLTANREDNTQRTYFHDGKVIENSGEFTRSKSKLNLFDHEQIKSAKAIQRDLMELKDAIYQKGNFDLSLEEIASYPKASYMILGGDNVNSYRAALRLEDHDETLKLILANPGKYKGRKIKLNWKIREPFEAVYTAGNWK